MKIKQSMLVFATVLVAMFLTFSTATADPATYISGYLSYENTLNSVSVVEEDDVQPVLVVGIQTDTALYTGAEFIVSSEMIAPAINFGAKYKRINFEVGAIAYSDNAKGAPPGYPVVTDAGHTTALYSAVVYKGFELRYIRYDDMKHTFNSKKQTGTDPITGKPVYSTSISSGVIDKEVFWLGYRHYFK